MTRSLRIACSFTILAACTPWCAPRMHAQSTTQTETAASRAGTAWLKLVDAGDYAESWRTASPSFQAAITQEKWEQALNTVRTPLGKLASRKLETEQVSTHQPGVPDGHFTTLLYGSSFANKAEAVETLTLAQELNGAWRTAGYYIR